MRRLFLQIFGLVILSTITNQSAQGANKSQHAIEYATTDHQELPSSNEQDREYPVSRPQRHEEHGKRVSAPRSEELPHIHHFHRGRVRGRRHKEYWLLSKLLLILCHIAVLVVAYLHVTPH
ncbi:MAG TPA: hypothetical protein VEB63_00815 [Chitinophagaceae bacterium]|nr:hypothetical protein [Chitinophagaceae bacterium]